jgi:hypothetical protein
MRHSPYIIPANTRKMDILSWNTSWFSKKHACMLSQEDAFFKKWIFTFFYKKQKKVFFKITGTKKKKQFSFFRISKRSTSHAINILKIRRKVATKAMNWVVHRIYISRTYIKVNIYIYLSCWMHSTIWQDAQKMCSKWFISQCQNRFSIINNMINCKLFWITPIKFKNLQSSELISYKIYYLKTVLLNRIQKNITKKLEHQIYNRTILKNKYLYLINETIYG